MSLLDAANYEAVFTTPEGDTYRVPLVCWHDDGTHVSGMTLHKGQLRRAEQVKGFMRYDTRPATLQMDTYAAGLAASPPPADRSTAMR
ncbi:MULTISPECIES: DUF6253 family protein [unclassified Streptomyces]|uniref:DUF6253 family protein n=1 Tax=unclassified Streptomyces TaxID=2593676 RepID=UPI0036666AD9